MAAAPRCDVGEVREEEDALVSQCGELSDERDKEREIGSRRKNLGWAG